MLLPRSVVCVARRLDQGRVTEAAQLATEDARWLPQPVLIGCVPSGAPVSLLGGMTEKGRALVLARAQVAAVSDDPRGRLGLITRTYHGPTGRAPRHLPFRRAALSFMRWQVRRGVLNPLDGSPPGSSWWRKMNERLLQDGCEAVALTGGLDGTPSSPAVGLWLDFIETPRARNWYRAHNASIVSGYLECRDRADTESLPERFFMNVVLG